mmetsp:Transcript_35355/g.56435  ORF Transcript_35355/g.56435 Transcript_35355/m.56435 type:complete len:357 (-) Transcript_35355:2476-3546(-)
MSGELRCYTAPGVVFGSREELHAHYKSEWHRYNLKRKVAHLPPIPLAMFEKLELINAERERASKADVKKQDHRKKSNRVTGEPKKQAKVPPKVPGELEDEDAYAIDESQLKKKVDVNECIFDGHVSETLEQNLEYMQKNFGLFIPDAEYLVDLPGLVKYCTQKVKAGKLCLFCDKPFATGQATIQHMVDKSHCKIPWDTADDVEEYEDFYDYSSLYETDTGKKKGKMNAEMLDSGELLLVNNETNERKVVGNRDYNRYYKQNFKPEDTRAAVVANSRERLLLLYQKAGVETSSALAKTQFNGKAPAWMDKKAAKQQRTDLRWQAKARIKQEIGQNLLTKNRQHQHKNMGAGFGVHG